MVSALSACVLSTHVLHREWANSGAVTELDLTPRTCDCPQQRELGTERPLLVLLVHECLGQLRSAADPLLSPENAVWGSAAERWDGEAYPDASVMAQVCPKSMLPWDL